jgi:hypothetical protein
MTRLREQIVRAKAENIKYIVIVIYQTTSKHVIVNHDPPPSATKYVFSGVVYNLKTFE